jgi:hypothetical protein
LKTGFIKINDETYESHLGEKVKIFKPSQHSSINSVPRNKNGNPLEVANFVTGGGKRRSSTVRRKHARKIRKQFK